MKNNNKNTKNNVILKILDEVNVVIIGLAPSEYADLYKKFGVHAPNYFWNPEYKMGRWDGKIRFFTKTGKTYMELLPQIIPKLRQWGYNIKLKDNRKHRYCELGQIDKDYFEDFGWELGEHQVEACNLALKEQKGIVVAGTGAGKTCMTAVICHVLLEKCNARSLIIVPNVDLIKQTALELKEFGLDVGEFSGDIKEYDNDVVVSTWQSLQNNKNVATHFKAIIVDECHGVKGNVLKEILNDYANNAFFKIGLTGTLPEHECDRMTVQITLGNVLCEVPAFELMEKGWLSTLHLTIYDLKEDFKDDYAEYKLANPQTKLSYRKFITQLFPDYSSEKRYLQTNKCRNMFIKELIVGSREGDKGNTFILVNGVAYGKKLAKMIDGAVFINSKDEKEARKAIYAQFEESNNAVVIATYNLASTGLNIKRIFNLYLIDAGKSFIRVIQSIGRGLRKAHDKDSVNVYDISSNLKYARKHCNNRVSHYKKSNYKYIKKSVDYKKYVC